MTEKTNKNLIPIAIVVAGVLIAGAVVFVSQQKTASPEIISAERAGEKVINFINENLLPEGMTASLVSITEESGVYKIWLEVEGQEFPSYVTKDGKLLFSDEGINLDEEIPVFEEPAEPAAPPVTILDEELEEFVGCLAKAGFVIYGANWCGWTQQLVTMLGGWGTVEPIYVECTEKQELCQEKGITGYPTILINDKQYQGARAFDGFLEATGCQMPEGAESLDQDNPAGGC